MYKILGAAAAVVLLAGCSTVQGVVHDKYTGSPVAAAVVTVGVASASTDGFGHYSLQGSFLPGATMMVNAPCYNIYTSTITSTKEIKDIDLTSKCGNTSQNASNSNEQH